MAIMSASMYRLIDTMFPPDASDKDKLDGVGLDFTNTAYGSVKIQKAFSNAIGASSEKIEPCQQQEWDDGHTE